MRHLIKAVALLTALTPPNLHAQASDPGQRLQERERIEDEVANLANDAPGQVITTPPPAGVVAEQPCFQIDDIEITNTSIFGPSAFAPILSEFTGACLGQISINNLINRISALYADAGYITSRAYVPAQDIGRGVLTIEVLEGRIEAFAYQQTAPDGTSVAGPRRKIMTAMPQSVGDVFQLRDLEHGLEQMNRLVSSQAGANLSAGGAPGTSVVTITEEVADRRRGSFSIDNRGSATTGRTQITLGVEADDLLQINDSWSGSYSGTRDSNALSLNVSAPFQRYRFSGSLSYSEEDSQLTDESFLLTQTLNANISAEALMSRTATAKAIGYLTADLYRNERTINLAELTPQRRSSATIGLRYENRWAKGIISTDTSLSFGTGLFGADWKTNLDNRSVQETDYRTLNARLTYIRPLDNGDQWSTFVTAQTASEALFSNNQISIGGWETVRGFSTDSFAGDRGVYIRNEYGFAPTRFESIERYVSGPVLLRSSLFADIGHVESIARDEGRTLSSIGANLSLQLGRSTLNGSIAFPIGGAERTENKGPQAYIAFSTAISD